MSITSPEPSSSRSASGPEVHEIGNRTYIVADVDPLDLDGVRTVGTGIVLWAVGFVVLLFFRDQLRADGHLWWIWACVAGFGLGLIGWNHCLRRRARRTRAEQAAPPPPAGG